VLYCSDTSWQVTLYTDVWYWSVSTGLTTIYTDVWYWSVSTGLMTIYTGVVLVCFYRADDDIH
jgi:hypothetical protein